jgi:hypothetical protein
MKALRGETNTDLFISVKDTEMMAPSNEVARSNEMARSEVRTNIHIDARVQLPVQHRVLFVCDRKDGKGPVCIVVSLGWVERKK